MSAFKGGNPCNDLQFEASGWGGERLRLQLFRQGTKSRLPTSLVPSRYRDQIWYIHFPALGVFLWVREWSLSVKVKSQV
jgi:hypothetical protein